MSGRVTKSCLVRKYVTTVYIINITPPPCSAVYTARDSEKQQLVGERVTAVYLQRCNSSGVAKISCFKCWPPPRLAVGNHFNGFCGRYHDHVTSRTIWLCLHTSQSQVIDRHSLQTYVCAHGSGLTTYYGSGQVYHCFCSLAVPNRLRIASVPS